MNAPNFRLPTDRMFIGPRIWGLRNVTSRQKLILLALYEWPSMSTNELLETVCCTLPTLRRELSALLDRGYVQRTYGRESHYSLGSGF